MKVLVNAPSVKEGGSLVVLEYLLESMTRLRPDIDWALAVHGSLRLSRNPPENLVSVDIGDIDRGCFSAPRWYELGLPAAVARLGVNVVFSMTNYLPIRRLPCPTVLLVQHAGHFSDVFDRLTRLHLRRADRIAAWRLKTRWVQRSVRMATEVTVQTAALADAIAARTGRSRAKIHVTPHGPGLIGEPPPQRPKMSGRPVRIGYIAKWGVQKNFDVLFAATVRWTAAGRDVQLVLTLDPNLAENMQLMARAKAMGLTPVIENVGNEDAAGISALYDSLDIFAFPSLVESFGFPLVEAMAKGLPVVAADTASNREVAGNAGSYFSPFDSEALATMLGRIIDDPSLRQHKAAAALQRAQHFSWERAAEQTLALLTAAAGSAAFDATPRKSIRTT
ncbi:MAG: glycosyltransferase family 4 protein [Methylocella sp.]